MPFLSGDFWIGGMLSTMPLSELSGAKIGVEATAYLQHMIDQPPSHEPLLAALAGEPISLKQHLEDELDLWASHNMTPLFVFEGQSIVGKDEMAMRRGKSSLANTNKAWSLYGDNQADQAVKTFGNAGGIRAADFYRILQDLLDERELEYIIAPFSACAQLAYLDNLEMQYIDGIMGSQDLLVYDINDAVISIPSAADWEKKAFSGIFKSDLIKKLNVTADMFTDAMLMVGTSFLPTFPPLQDPEIIRNQPAVVVDAINLLRTSEKSVTTTCTAFSDILQGRDPDWLDKYRRAKMGVKHCVTVNEDGKVLVRDYDHLTGDNHEYIGLQLPPELYHYLSTAVVGPRLLSPIGSLESVVYPTLDGVISDEYRQLMTQTLVPLKELTASLISSRVHRGFQFRPIHMKYWFDDTLKQQLNHRGRQPQTNNQADTWGVKEKELKAQEEGTGAKFGKLSFALLALQNGLSSRAKAGEVSGLSINSELLPNALWRLLHLRGYINNEHELTNWGKALATTLNLLAPTIKKHDDVNHAEEAAFLAYELLRFDNLNSRNRHPELIGGPLRGSGEDKANCLLIGRTACLLKIRHKNIGYTGPLSKNFLHYYSIIKAVRETDRDLLEAIVASMLLSGQASREGGDFKELGRSLPFSTDINVALGIGVKTYLDDYCKPDLSHDLLQATKLQYATSYLPHSINFAEDLEVAFTFFDALHEGVKTLTDAEISVADKEAWSEAAAYLARRR